MKLDNGYIINPADFRAGQLYISPFRSEDAFLNRRLWLESSINNTPWVNLNGNALSVTESATRALEIILKHLNLMPEDEVCIFTTSGNKYISGCVTRTIEKFCKWSREMTEQTAAILVNHEFGFVYREMQQLKTHNLPIIEDCAYSMYSSLNGVEAGSIGDYAIFSLAKMFPVQAGGLLYSKFHKLVQNDLSADEICYYKACFAHYNEQMGLITQQRLTVYNQLKEEFEKLGFESRFQHDEGEVPGAFLFMSSGLNFEALKEFLQLQGIECSVFYGEEAFYLPCHQSMTSQHVDYLVSLIKYFIK